MGKILMFKRVKNKKGMVLVSVYGVGITLLSMMGIYGLRSVHENQLAQRHSESAAAFYIAEAAVNELIDKLHNTGNYSNIGDIYNYVDFVNLGDYTEDATYRVEIIPDTDPPSFKAFGKVNGIERGIKVELGFNIPVPENAINIFGSPTKHIKLEIHDHDKKSENGEILVSGVDLGGGPDQLAVGVEDPATLTALIDKLGKDLKKSGDLEDTLMGSPMTDFTDSKGNDFTASIGLVGNKGYDADFLEEAAKILADNARAMTPTITLDLSEDKFDDFLDSYKDETGTVILGSTSTDVIYMSGGKKLKLEKESDTTSIVGTGTLIIDGAKFDLQYANFDWTGDIYILGGATGKKNDAEFKVRRASVDITGDIFLLSNSTDEGGKGKVKMELDNDTGAVDGASTIVGSILAYGGTGDKSSAELKIKRGGLNMQGFISMMGTKTKLEIKQEKAKVEGDPVGDINIRGGISLLVPEVEKEKKEKAEIKLHARGGGEGDFKIQYDSVIVEAAVKRLQSKLSNITKLLQVITWEEIYE